MYPGLTSWAKLTAVPAGLSLEMEFLGTFTSPEVGQIRSLLPLGQKRDMKHRATL